MGALNLFELFSYFISEKEEKYLREKAKDYLLFFGNNKPNKSQLRVMQSLLDKHSLLFNDQLTFQERKCLTLAFQGKSMQESADILKISFNSIKYYRKSLIKNLGCKNIVEATFIGLRYGLILKHKEI